jgi:hypothetical protein
MSRRTDNPTNGRHQAASSSPEPAATGDRPKSTPAVQPHVIRKAAVYTRESAQLAVGGKKTFIAREIRLGRLRASKRGGRYYILGEWLLQWLREGEVRRHRPVTAGLSGAHQG